MYIVNTKIVKMDIQYKMCRNIVEKLFKEMVKTIFTKGMQKKKRSVLELKLENGTL